MAQTYLEGIRDMQEWSGKIKDDLMRAIAHEGLKAFLSTGAALRFAMSFDLRSYESAEPSADAFFRNLSGTRMWLRLLEAGSDVIHEGLICVDASHVKRAIMPYAQTVLHGLTEHVSRAFSRQCTKIADMCRGAAEELRMRPSELPEFTDYVYRMMEHYSSQGEAQIRVRQEFIVARRCAAAPLPGTWGSSSLVIPPRVRLQAVRAAGGERSGRNR